MLKKLFILIFILFSLTLSAFSLDLAERNVIRVGISDNSFLKYNYNSAEFTCDKDFQIIDKKTGLILALFPKSTKIKVVMEDNIFKISLFDNKESKEPIESEQVFQESDVIIYSPAGGLISIAGLQRASKPASYRGKMELVKSSKLDSTFLIVNELGLEEYLRGVVPNEMPAKFSEEALKAQSIVARNYALRPRTNPCKEYDICDSVACQVYFGANTEHTLTNKAIEMTKNNVLLYKDDLILAQYSSTAGGYTENYENVFSDSKKNLPSNPVPYLKGRPDDSECSDLQDEEKARAFYSSAPKTFDNKSPYFRWEMQWKREELEDILKVNLKNQTFSGFISPNIAQESELGTLQDIKVMQRGVSGKIISLKIITDKGEYTVKKELVIRQILQKDNKNLPSANAFFDVKTNADGCVEKITAIGGGLGHGVGMSQWGAGCMAEKGSSFDDILQHYYTGVSLGTPPVILENTPGKNIISKQFCAPYDKARLFVENKSTNNLPAKVSTVLNGKEIEIDFAKLSSKKVYCDISEFINKGSNEAVFKIPLEDKKKMQVKMYIELKEAKRGQ